jgi:GNAT superfamily N-acetyltransferase
MAQELPPNQEKLTVGEVDPNDIQSIEDYYRFEIDQGFSEVNPRTTFDAMIKFRKSQLEDGQMRVAIVKEEGKTVGTEVLVLKKGTMGKEIKENEAWAAGTVVDKGKRGSGIAQKLLEAQEKMARESGKEAILTNIANNNFPSTRLYLKSGYGLEGVAPRTDETNYIYRKNLLAGERPAKDWTEEVLQGKLKFGSSGNQEKGDRVLVDPDNREMIESLIKEGYRGVYLLTPKDFIEPGVIKKNYFVFVKEGKEGNGKNEEPSKEFEKEKAKSAEETNRKIEQIREELKQVQ